MLKLCGCLTHNIILALSEIYVVSSIFFSFHQGPTVPQIRVESAMERSSEYSMLVYSWGSAGSRGP